MLREQTIDLELMIVRCPPDIEDAYINRCGHFYHRAYRINILAAYDPLRNILYTCDITHSSDDILAAIRMWDLFKYAFNLRCITAEQDAGSQKRVEITIGCDPEFEYVDKNSRDIIEARVSPLINRLRRDTSYDPYDSAIGLDGSSAQIEIRPRPANTPDGLIWHIKHIFEEISDEVLICNGDTYPLGCHVHIGVGNSWTPPYDIINAIDDFIGIPCRKLNGTARGSYSELGAVRTQPHGFEYRSLPSAVTLDPRFFKIILKIIHGIVDSAVNKSGFTYSKDRIPLDAEYERFISRDELAYFKEFINSYEQSYLNGAEPNIIAAWVSDATYKSTGDIPAPQRITRRPPQEQSQERYYQIWTDGSFEEVTIEEARRSMANHSNCIIATVSFRDRYNAEARRDLMDMVYNGICEYNRDHADVRIQPFVTFYGIANSTTMSIFASGEMHEMINIDCITNTDHSNSFLDYRSDRVIIGLPPYLRSQLINQTANNQLRNTIKTTIYDHLAYMDGNNVISSRI